MAAQTQLSVQSEGIEKGTSSAEMSPQPPQEETRSQIPSHTLRQCIFSWRAFMALHMNLAIVMFVVFKINMSIALVCMLKAPLNGNVSLVGENATLFNVSGLVPGEFGGGESGRTGNDDAEIVGSDLSVDVRRGEFEWDSSIQGLILTSANILGFVMPLMADLLTRKMGAKLLLMLAMVISAALTLLHPLGARMSPYVLMAMRLALGFVGGVAFPIVTEIFSWWAPEKEKVSMMSAAFAGVNIGNVVAGITSGYLCSVDIDNGWPFIFYAHGALALLWCVLWQFTGSARPEDHPFISEDEKLYILRTRVGMTTNKNQKRTSPPYKAILTSVPVWGYLCVMASHYFSSITLFSYLPLFLTRAFGIDVEDVGLISSVGYVVRFIGVIMWGQLSNLLLKETRIGTTACRKIVQCGGFYLATAALVVLGFITDRIPAIIIVFTVMFLQSASMASGIVIPLDMAPRFAGFLSGLFTATASLVTFPGPIIAGLMTEHGTLDEWRNLFIILAVVFFTGATFFLFLGSSKLQTWAIPPEGSEAEEKQDPLHASNLMARRMTVLSMGPPVSPTRNQTRFDFTIEDPSTSFEATSVQYNINSPNSQPKANGSLEVKTYLSNTEKTNMNTQPEAFENTPSATSHHTRPDKVSYTNPGFEADSQNVQHQTAEHTNTSVQVGKLETGNASSSSKSEGQQQKSSRGLKLNPGLKLNVSQSVPVSFDACHVAVDNSAGKRDGDDGFEEVNLRTSGDLNVTQQTRL